MSAHTPGPWKVHQRPTEPRDFGHHVTTEHGLTVCAVNYQLPSIVEGVAGEHARIANARLIAAAPELLEVLQRLMAVRSRCLIPEVDGNLNWDDDARSAIAKATGAAP